MKQSIYFRVDADKGIKIGLGHLQRTLTLYREIKKFTKSKKQERPKACNKKSDI